MDENLRIDAAIRQAMERLESVSDSARLDAQLLTALAINMPRSYLFAHPEDTLDPAAIARLDALVERRLAGVPMAYIIGKKEFWSLDLVVSPATLVPRPETEILVDHALRELRRRSTARVLDLGTGSGAVALAIAHDRRSAHITATDISEDALAVARVNARELGLGNVQFLRGCWTEPVAGETFDVIVSNPPYVAASDEALERLVAEPQSALVAGDDGLDAIRVLARDCPAILADDGVMLIEHGAEQEDAVRAILEETGWIDIRCIKDYAALPRVTRAQRTR